MDQPEQSDDAAFLRSVKARLAVIYHDMNNPLAVASGNVQFVEELVRSGDLTGVAEALEDVRRAVALLDERLQELRTLRDAIEGRLNALREPGDA